MASLSILRRAVPLSRPSSGGSAGSAGWRALRRGAPLTGLPRSGGGALLPPFAAAAAAASRGASSVVGVPRDGALDDADPPQPWAAGGPRSRSDPLRLPVGSWTPPPPPAAAAPPSRRRYSTVFVSKYASFDLSAKDILEYCERAPGVSVVGARTTHEHVVLRECPLCPKPTNGRADNLYKLYLQIGRGAYFCHRCGAGGSWLDWKARTGGVVARPTSLRAHAAADGRGSHPPAAASLSATDVGGGVKRGRGRPRSAGGAGVSSAGGASYALQHPHFGGGGGGGAAAPNGPAFVAPLPMPPQRLQALYSSNLLGEDAHDPSSVLHYLAVERGLELRTLRKYGVGKAPYQFPDPDGSGSAWRAHDCVTFSWIMSERDAHTQEQLRGAAYESPEGSGGLPPSAASAPSGGAAGDAAAAVAPSPADRFVTRRIKARSITNKACQRLDPPGGAWGFFGYHTVPEDATEVVLTEGEYDAMSVWQATGRPAISLPNGCRSLPVSALPLLERFQKVYLWMDNDGPGQEGAEVFAKKIGLERCYLVRPTPQNCPNPVASANDAGQQAPTSSASSCLPKDANEALLRGCDLNRILDSSKLTPHEGILSFDDLRDDVLHEILHPDKYVGRPMPSLPGFTRIAQGLRRGELWVLTGPTGCGKTTFLTQLSLDLAEQGAHVLWGSFEIKNTRLVRKMMQQYSREPLPTDPTSSRDRLEAMADRFAQLPLHFLKFHGSTDVDDVLNAMEYAVYVNDCQHIILDNMQFMISRQNSNSSFDKFDIQDVAVEKFRKFATERNVHITLVVHPKKHFDNTRLDLSSVYGSAKATQEADLVLILQDEGTNRKFLDVRKNRFNGDLGTSPLFFDRKSGRYQEVPLVNVKAGPPSLSDPSGGSSSSRGRSGPSSPSSSPGHERRQYNEYDARDFVEWSEDETLASASSYSPVKVRTLPRLPVPGTAPSKKPNFSSANPGDGGSLLDLLSVR